MPRVMDILHISSDQVAGQKSVVLIRSVSGICRGGFRHFSIEIPELGKMGGQGSKVDKK